MKDYDNPPLVCQNCGTDIRAHGVCSCATHTVQERQKLLERVASYTPQAYEGTGEG
jgi:hypothetical protein